MVVFVLCVSAAKVLDGDKAVFRRMNTTIAYMVDLLQEILILVE